MKISDLLIKDRINLDVKSTNKVDIIKELARLHEKTGVLNDYDGYVKALMAREEQSSTGIGEGIAIPHAKTKFVKKPALAMGRKPEGIDYDSLDGEPATLFFMIAAPDGANNTHIETLARLSQLLLDDDFKEALENAATSDEIIEIINKTEAEKFPEENVQKKEEKSAETTIPAASGDAPYIIAATACPTGIAHTYMAAAALKKAAEEMGVKIKVETNGADGRKDILTTEDIKEAKGVILAINRNIEVDRFDGKPLIQVEAKEGINNAKALIQQVLDGKAPIFHASGSSTASSESASSEKKGLYKHLLSGVSYMLPLVISGGILIALAFLVDTLSGNGGAGAEYGSKAPLAKMLKDIGGQAFGLFVPVLAGYIAYSISERAALSAGLVAGAIATAGGSGFIGALLGGFLAGYVVKGLVKGLSGMPRSLNGLKMILLYPVLSVLITGVGMVLVINPFASIINNALNNWLNGMSGSSAVLLGAVLGGMMAIDMGGPVNKAAYVFGSGTLAATMTSGGSLPMAAVMAGGMVPPIAIALASTLFKNKFTAEEREAGLTNYIMGFSFITEGAIPYAAADPTRVIPASVIGSAIAGALTGLFSIKIPAPHGGILVMALSNNFLLYLLAVVIGSIAAAFVLGFLKPAIKQEN
ncbi:PTS fructose transporter subunit IIABC [Leptotrichia sp. HSP-536]|uniref:Fructose-specific PTS transporter subunit EIIC n=1 Tax=Leptotrichia alba TaxID=3239304 RepID=A0AB39V550_9FUSO